MQTISIIQAGENDVVALQQIAQTTFIAAYAAVNTQENMDKYLHEDLGLPQLRSELNNPHSLFFFAQLDGQNIGYIKLNIGDAQTHLQEKNTLEIERIYVLPPYQSMRIGQQLFDHAVALAKARAYTKVWLAVWEQNHKAIQFYTRNGFTVFDTCTFTLGNDVQNDLMMALTL
ncbi:acetyltransferase (GNAT) family protein [Chitinophaga skermanii]|uniref:Acetyltransferase (GNAT) family protein n=1 Tax=Chitinophaga skermanii TaxID=331697 RepID=A0A327R2W1_9BACT|nr:GNAT family N-acetyltransferase [Chitinophaga skermanii]RAJ08227.1 acetyltransferase (GNAT) family protein [Chitinophaga skermanii]